MCTGEFTATAPVVLQYTYVKRKRDRLLSRQHFCYRKAINITCSECVSVALVAQHARPISVII